jgi:hypothetical protein
MTSELSIESSGSRENNRAAQPIARSANQESLMFSKSMDKIRLFSVGR